MLVYRVTTDLIMREQQQQQQQQQQQPRVSPAHIIHNPDYSNSTV